MHMEVAFYRTDSGGEPVRDWLKGLAKADLILARQRKTKLEKSHE